MTILKRVGIRFYEFKNYDEMEKAENLFDKLFEEFKEEFKDVTSNQNFQNFQNEFEKRMNDIQINFAHDPTGIDKNSSENKSKYVWLNINNGQFSNSWTNIEEDVELTKENIKNAKNAGYKLIKYKCLNDKDFEFSNLMKLK